MEVIRISSLRLSSSNSARGPMPTFDASRCSSSFNHHCNPLPQICASNSRFHHTWHGECAGLLSNGQDPGAIPSRSLPYDKVHFQHRAARHPAGVHYGVAKTNGGKSLGRLSTHLAWLARSTHSRKAGSHRPISCHPARSLLVRTYLAASAPTLCPMNPVFCAAECGEGRLKQPPRNAS